MRLYHSAIIQLGYDCSDAMSGGLELRRCLPCKRTCLQPPTERSLALAGRLSEQNVLRTDIFIEIGPQYASQSSKKLIGIQTAPAHIELVKHIFDHRIRRPGIPARIIPVEFDRHDDARADIGTPPLAGPDVEFQADVKVVFGHWRSVVSLELFPNKEFSRQTYYPQWLHKVNPLYLAANLIREQVYSRAAKLKLVSIQTHLSTLQFRLPSPFHLADILPCRGCSRHF